MHRKRVKWVKYKLKCIYQLTRNGLIFYTFYLATFVKYSDSIIHFIWHPKHIVILSNIGNLSDPKVSSINNPTVRFL